MKIIRSIPFAALLIVSFALAVIACGLTRHSLHFWYDRSNVVGLAFRVFAPALVWVLMVSVGLVAHGWRGLWLLIGTPFALLWPYMFMKLHWQCWTGSTASYLCE